MRQLLAPEPLHRRGIRAGGDLDVQVQAVMLLKYAQRERLELGRLVRGYAPVAAHLRAASRLIKA